MDIPTQEQLLDRIEDFRDRHDLAETRFGRDAINNPNFIRGLREGVSPTLDTLTKVLAYMKQKDEEAATQAKLHAPLEPMPDEEAVDEPLPFGTAPEASRPGASSPISSPMRGPSTSSAVTNTNRCSAGTAE